MYLPGGSTPNALAHHGRACLGSVEFVQNRNMYVWLSNTTTYLSGTLCQGPVTVTQNDPYAWVECPLTAGVR